MWGIYFVFCVFIYTATAQSNSCGQNGYTYPDTENCHQYYMCNSGSPVVYKCPVGLYWNCDTSTCDRKRWASCCPGDPSVTILGRPVSCPINGMKLPKIVSCGTYYQCSSMHWIKKMCPYGQRFALIGMKCKTATMGKCAPTNPTTKTTTITTTTTTSTTTPTTTSTTTPTTTTITTPTPPATPSTPTIPPVPTVSTSTASTTTKPTSPTSSPGPKCWVNVTVADVANCNNFYTCNGGLSIAKKSCSSGMYYNCFKRACSTTKTAHCCYSPLPPANNTCSTNGAKTPVPLSCTSYYECVNNQVVKQKCPNHLAFDIWSSTCKPLLTARCGLKPGLTVCTAGVNGTLPFAAFNFDIAVYCPKW